MQTTTILLLIAVSMPLCMAFSPSLPHQQPSSRISEWALAAGDSWYSSLPQDPDLLTNTMEPKEFRKVIEPGDSNRVMNELQFPVMDSQQQQPASKEELAAMKQALEQEIVVGKRKMRASVRETGYDSMRSYIKTMCNHELLNKNEEVVLAREIQLLMKWEEKREELEGQLMRYVALCVLPRFKNLGQELTY